MDSIAPSQSSFQLNSPSTVTQLIYLTIPQDRDLKNADSYHGRLWASALDIIENSPGFHRLYWGRSLEKPVNVQLHIVRSSLQQHRDFLKSPAFRDASAFLQALASSGSSNPIRAIRHAALVDQTPNCKALAKGAPFTGSAIYLRPIQAWNEGAWPLWTNVVPKVDGNLGCAGGSMLEPIELLEDPVLLGEDGRPTKEVPPKGTRWEGYIVYVGWQSVEQHEAYHHTKHFAQHAVILRCGNAGFAEYGHVVFEGSRERGASFARL